jgi:soluble P-type ATPase
MLPIPISGFGHLELDYLVLDYNGTLAVDGSIVEGVPERLQRLSRDLAIHVITADTFGRARIALAELPCNVVVLNSELQDEAKRAYVESLGPTRCVCIGNGRNDALMLECAALGIAVLQAEGAAGETLGRADVVCRGITDALDLLLHPLRLTATLRC